MQWMLDLEAVYPNVAELMYLNKTFLGRDLLGIKVHTYLQNGCENTYLFAIAIQISDNSTQRSSKFEKPKIWIDAGMHAREYIATSTVLYMIHQVPHDQMHKSRKILGVFIVNDWICKQ